MDKEMTFLILVILCIIAIFVFVGIGIYRTFKGRAVFFNSYWDLAAGYALLISYVIAFFISRAQDSVMNIANIIVPIIFIGYNIFMSMMYNRDSKFTMLCVFLGRVLVGYIMPLIVLGLYISGGSSKRDGETDGAYAVRKGVEYAATLATVAGMFYFLNKLMHHSKNTLKVRKDAIRHWK